MFYSSFLLGQCSHNYYTLPFPIQILIYPYCLGGEFSIKNLQHICLHLLLSEGSQCEEEAGGPLRVLRDSCTSINEIPLITALAITDLSAQEVADYPQQVERLEKHVTRRYVYDLS